MKDWREVSYLNILAGIAVMTPFTLYLILRFT